MHTAPIRAEYKHNALDYLTDSEMQISENWLNLIANEVRFLNRILSFPKEDIKKIFTMDELFLFYKRKKILSDLVTIAYNATMESQQTKEYLKMLKSTKRLKKIYKFSDYSEEEEFIKEFENII